MATPNQIREDLLKRVHKPVLSRFDQASFALAARDAFWDSVQAVIAGGGEDLLYEQFYEWQHQLTLDLEPYDRYIQRALRDQVDNASHPQLREYASYFHDVAVRGDDPWKDMGSTVIAYHPEGPYGDGPAIRVTRAVAGEAETDSVVTDEPEAIEEAVRDGWRFAFESMLPMYVRIERRLLPVWEPWLEKPDAPVHVAEALELLYKDAPLRERHTRGLGRLVGPVGVAIVLVDPDMDREFWAGEWTDDFLERAPSEDVGMAMLKDRAPKLFEAIGG